MNAETEARQRVSVFTVRSLSSEELFNRMEQRPPTPAEIEAIDALVRRSRFEIE